MSFGRLATRDLEWARWEVANPKGAKDTMVPGAPSCPRIPRGRVGAPSFLRRLTVKFGLSVLSTGNDGAMVDFPSEIMPAEVRTFGFLLACSLAPAVFGSFTPAVFRRIDVTGNPAIPGPWFSH